MNIFSISAEDQRKILKVDAGALAAFIACPFKAYLEYNDGPSGDKNAIEHQLCKEYLEYRTAVIKQWSDKAKNGRGAPCSTRLLVSICVAVCDPASLIDKPAALLTRIEEVEKTGSKRKQNLYVPLGFSLEPKVSRQEKMRVAFTALILAEAGYKTASYGRIVVGPSFATRRVELIKPKRQVSEEVQRLLPIVNDNQKTPFGLNAHCGVCRFFEDCRRKALEHDDLSLMGTLSSREIDSLNKRGIFTVTQLSHSFRNRRCRKCSRPEKHLPALRALAIREQKIYVRDPPTLPETQTQIFLDVEGIPERDFYYLVGAVVRTEQSVENYSIWADGPEDQEQMWRDFVELLRKYESATIFHYGSYDSKFMKRMNERFQTKDAAALEKLLTSSINVLTYFYHHIYFPTYTNSLKEIADFLGFSRRGSIHSGLMSIQIRKLWEVNRDSSIKQALIEYNNEDCIALQCVVNAIRKICDGDAVADQEVTSAETLSKSGTYGFGDKPCALADFEFINKCAYFDYQRTKIYWRTDKKVKRSKARRVPKKKRNRRINKTVRCYRRKCPKCGGAKISVIRKDRFRDVYDIVFGQTGARRQITRYIGHEYRCSSCRATFHPRNLSGRRIYGHGVLAWVIYGKIGLRQTNESIRLGLNDLFGFSFGYSLVPKFQKRAVSYYSVAFNEIKHAIRSSHVVHVDETKVNFRGGSGYVWVFTTTEEVLYVYSDTREGSIVPKVLRGFKGVLVSDFYAAYESMGCLQQRCLVHLIRDLNDDLVKNPFDAEFKVFVVDFGKLLRSIVETIDRFGLKSRFLRKHKKEVRRFFRTRVEVEPDSVLTQKYVQRFKKNENCLFMFLDHDGVPWNNNNAENAIKAFAALRKGGEAQFTVNGLNKTLPMLSIAQTLRNKDVSFLDFLKSGRTSWRVFLDKGN